jgi:hypothetical protein
LSLQLRLPRIRRLPYRVRYRGVCLLFDPLAYQGGSIVKKRSATPCQPDVEYSKACGSSTALHTETSVASSAKLSDSVSSRMH